MRILLLLLVAEMGLLASARAQTNDNFANRLTLSGSTATAVSNNAYATREAGEPNHAANAAGRSLWWTWTAPTTGVANFSTFGGVAYYSQSHVLAVYTGSDLAALTEVGSSNYTAGTFYPDGPYSIRASGKSVSLPVTAGTVYQIAVDSLALPQYGNAYFDDGTVVLCINTPPTFASGPAGSATVGTSYEYDILTSNNPTSYGATGLPVGLSLNPYTGVISGVVGTAGTYTIGLSATGPGGSGTAVLTLEVADPAPAVPSSPPVITSTASTQGLVGVAFSFSLYASSATSYTASNLPPGLTLNASSGFITGTPTNAGTYLVPVTATNAAGTSGATITLGVASAPPLPEVTSVLTASGYTGSTLSYRVTTQGDYNGVGYEPTGYTASGLPPGLSLSASGTLSGTPTQAGTFPVAIGVTNGGGTQSVVVTITIAVPPTIPPATQPPVLNSATAAQGIVSTTFSYKLAATNSPTSFTAGSLPTGLSCNASTGTITGTPTIAGTYTVPVTATNAYGTSAGTLTIAVLTSAQAATGANLPVLTIASPDAALGYTGSTFSYQASATFNGSAYGFYRAPTYIASGLPAGLSLNASTGTISGTPTGTGTYPVTINATATVIGSGVNNIQAASGGAVVTLILGAGPKPTTAVPDVPLITSAASTVSQDAGASVYSSSAAQLSYTITATQSPTSFAATNLPAGLSLNPVTGVISGLPSVDGTFQVPISATNAQGTGSATLTVVTTAARPVIGAALVVNASLGGAVSYPFYTNLTSASTPYNQPPAHTALVFAAAGLPPGLSLNSSIGLISGTPTQTGTYPVALTATNREGAGRAVSTFIVGPALPPAVPTTAPTLSGYAQAQGFIGLAMSYNLSGSGAASYTATGLPDGLSLNTSTGLITGTPTTAGVYSVLVAATNAAGTTQATLTVAIDATPFPLYCVSSAAATARIGQSVDLDVWFLPVADGSPDPTNTTITSALPAGLSLTSYGDIAYIVGTPTGPTGTYTIGLAGTVGATTSTAVLTLTILPASSEPTATTTALLSIPAGALGFVDNYFSDPLNSSLYTPNNGLPDGLSYDQATSVLVGYPGAAGTDLIALAAPATSGGSGSSAVASSGGKQRVTLVRAGVQPRADSGGGHQAVLTLNVLQPELSLPQLVSEPLSVVAKQGESFAFSVSAVGIPAPIHQWFHNGAAVGGATGPTLMLSNVQAADAGSYTVTASNLTGGVTSLPATLTIQTSYAAWQTAHFTAQEIAAGLAADGRDFNGDGVPNLIEYALGRDPRTGLGGTLPVAAHPAATGALSLTFRRDASEADLDYAVEGSSDLSTWTTLASSTAGASTVGLAGTSTQESAVAGTSDYTVVVTAVRTTGGSSDRQFLRLRINRH